MKVSISLGWTLPVTIVLSLYKITGQPDDLSWWLVLSPIWVPWLLMFVYIVGHEAVRVFIETKKQHEKR